MRISHTNKPQVFMTMGDPAGIGPEVIMRAMASPDIRGLAVFVILADKKLIKLNAPGLVSPEELVFHDTAGKTDALQLDGEKINVVDPGAPLEEITPGVATEEGAEKALACIDAAVDIMLEERNTPRKAVVTAPVSKEAVSRIHEGFTGHTEYFQQASSSPMVTMVLAGKNLTVVPVTRHIPIKEIPSRLSEELILKTIEQVVKDRAVISGKDPVRIGVSALNPHCGENGKIGTEEVETIAPAVEKAKKLYAHIEGPISADVIFYKALKKEIDIVVSMYHDQCLAPFKMVDFSSGVNITLGLGWVRTSPDHGTAFNIAGKGTADPESMKQAIKLAVRAVSGN